MIEINLIPDVKQELLKAQRTRAAVISTSIFVSLIAGGIVVLLVLYVFVGQTVRGTILDGQIEEQNKTLSQVEDLSKVLTIQNQLSKISQLNSQKNIDSRIFDVLSAIIPPGRDQARVSQVIIDAEESTVRIEGQTRGYDSMEVFKKTIDSAVLVYAKDGEQQTTKLADEINVSDTSYGENAEGQKVLRFSLSFVYAKELFSADIDAMTIKLSIDGNVTDSYLGIPKSIFTERATDL